MEASFDYADSEFNRLYYRAFARNSLFESFGTKKRARLPEFETIPEKNLFPDALELEGGWKENWLGVWSIDLPIAEAYKAKQSHIKILQTINLNHHHL